MKTLTIFKLLIIMSITSAFSQNENKLKTEVDSLSYAWGVNIGQYLKSSGVDKLNYEAITQGMKDVYTSASLLIPAEKVGEIINSNMEKVKSKKEKENKEKFAKVIKEGDDFLAANKKRAKVLTTSSGLQYEIIKQGTGPKPKATDKVKVHYHGTLIDGTVFDSSVQRGEPIVFPVNGVIKGWIEALQLMPVGSKYKLFIPYNLAYGEQGAGGSIGPYSTLIFEVELLGIEK